MTRNVTKNVSRNWVHSYSKLHTSIKTGEYSWLTYIDWEWAANLKHAVVLLISTRLSHLFRRCSKWQHNAAVLTQRWSAKFDAIYQQRPKSGIKTAFVRPLSSVPRPRMPAIVLVLNYEFPCCLATRIFLAPFSSVEPQQLACRAEGNAETPRYSWWRR